MKQIVSFLQSRWGWLWFLPLVMVIPHLLARYGLDCTDTSYFLRAYTDWRHLPETYHYGLLLSHFSCYIGSIFVEQWGWNYLAIQHLAVAVIQCTIFIPFLFLWERPVDVRRMGWIFVGAQLLLVPAGTFIFSFDMLTPLLLGLVFGLFVYHLRHPSAWPVVATGLLCAVLITIRFPNIILVGILVVLLLSEASGNRKWGLVWGKNLLLLTVGLSVGMWGILALTFNRPGDYGTFICKAFSANESTHQTAYLLFLYLLDFAKIVRNLLLLGAFVVVAQLLSKRSKAAALIVSACGTVAVVAYLWYRNAPHNVAFHFLFIALLWGLTATYIWQNRHSKRARLIGCAILAFSVIPCTGSNTGLYKVAIYAFLPLAYYIAWPVIRKWRYVAVIPILIVALYLPLRWVSFTYRDAGLPSLTTGLPYAQLKGIKTTPQKAEWVTDVGQTIEGYLAKGERPVLMGKSRFIFQYLYGLYDLFDQSFSAQWNEPFYLGHLENYLSTPPLSPFILLEVDEYPNQTTELLEKYRHELKRADNGVLIYELADN